MAALEGYAAAIEVLKMFVILRTYNTLSTARCLTSSRVELIRNLYAPSL